MTSRSSVSFSKIDRSLTQFASLSSHLLQGTDPQPYFRIFNPLSQSEKSDPDGEYIRHWVPELSKVKGKAIHAPFDRLDKKEFEKLGYPKPIVEHTSARKRALARFKNPGNADDE